MMNDFSVIWFDVLWGVWCGVCGVGCVVWGVLRLPCSGLLAK
jgi:hypothetical protein